MARTASLLAFAVWASGCSGAEPPLPPPLPPPPPRLSTPPVPVRWIPLEGATALGPKLPEGWTMLLDGRRALVAPTGALAYERSPTPEPLERLALVPTAAGPKLVGASDRAIYRFDDPLGPGVALAQGAVASLGGAPGGRVAAFFRAASAVAPDPGRRSPSDPPAARAELSWLDVATGAPSAPPTDFPAARLSSVAFRSELVGSAVFPSVGLVATTDGGRTWSEPQSVAKGRELTPWTPEDLAGAPPLVDLLGGRSSPLALAVGYGRLLADGRALVPLGDILLPVDLTSGAVEPLLAARPSGATARCIGRCLPVWARDGERRLLLEIPLDGTRPGSADAATIAWWGRTQRSVLSSRAGGLALEGPCGDEPRPGAPGSRTYCVRLPSGRFVERALTGNALAHAALAHGELATLARHGQGCEHRFERWGDGMTPFPVFDAREPDGAGACWTLHGGIEEQADGALVALFETPRGYAAVRQATTSERALVTRFDGATLGDFAEGHGFASSGQALWVTSDGGARWDMLPGPGFTPNAGHASEVGLVLWHCDAGRCRGAARVGWEPPWQGYAPRPDRAPPARPGRPAKPLALTCSSTGKKAPPLALPARAPGATLLFFGGEAQGFTAAAEVKGDAWTLSWLDLREVGGKLHEARGKGPSKGPLERSFAAVDGDTFALVGLVDSKSVGLRAHGGKLETADWPVALPQADQAAVFGDAPAVLRAQADGAVTWALGGSAGVWLAREPPRVLATFSPAVELFALSSRERESFALLSGDAAGLEAAVVPAPLRKPVEGLGPLDLGVRAWREAGASPEQVGALAACDKAVSAKGAPVRYAAWVPAQLALTLGGAPDIRPGALEELRVHHAEVEVLFSPGPAAPACIRAARVATADGGTVRADLVAGRAEGKRRAGDAVEVLRCGI